jgi:hypothetical protein
MPAIRAGVVDHAGCGGTFLADWKGSATAPTSEGGGDGD